MGTPAGASARRETRSASEFMRISGKKSSVTIVNDEGKAEKESLTCERQDFWTTTSNKQLNFLRHVKTLKQNRKHSDTRGMDRMDRIFQDSQDPTLAGNPVDPE